jgi:hypothetical protein
MKHLTIIMTALRLAHQGDKQGSIEYVKFLAEKLEEDGEDIKILHSFIECLEGKKPFLYFYPQNKND